MSKTYFCELVSAQVASGIGPIAAECRHTRLCAGSGSPEVSQLWPSNGCQIRLGFGCADLVRLWLRNGALGTLGPAMGHISAGLISREIFANTHLVVF